MSIHFPKSEEYFRDLIEEELHGKRRYTVRVDTIIGLAEERRLDRAKNVDILALENVSSGVPTVERYDFEAESMEKSESDSHIGYVELMKRSGNVHSMWCSCSDFQSRFAYYNEKNHNIGDYDKGGEIGAMKEYFDPHNQDAPVVKNPDDALGLSCKHVLKVLSEVSEKEL